MRQKDKKTERQKDKENRKPKRQNDKKTERKKDNQTKDDESQDIQTTSNDLLRSNRGGWGGAVSSRFFDLLN